MALADQLKTDMKEAMKARDKARLSTVRMLMAAVKNATIEKGGDLSEDDELSLLASQAKRRRESIKAYDEGGREDLAKQERAELAVIETYLPQQLSKEEVEAIAKEVVAEVGATSKRDMGKVMGKLMPKLKGRFPGKQVGSIVNALLES